MVGPPSGDAPAIPSGDLEEVTSVPGYLDMRVKDGVALYTPLSPLDDSVRANAPEIQGADDTKPAEEEIPMLQTAVPPKPKARRSVNSQYVNVPSEIKSTSKAKEDFVNNPGYVSVATTET